MMLEAVADVAATGATMLSAVVTEPGKIQLRQVPVPEPQADQLRIRLEGCGVCASNIPPFEGRPWFAYPLEPGQLGHEGWGVVDAVGRDVHAFAPGQRVAFLSNHAYAQYDLAAADAVVALPPELDGKPFPAEPLGCAVNIFRRSGVRRGDTVAIVGIGFMGALLTSMASRAGVRVIAIARREFAQSVAWQMGAGHVLAMNDHWNIIEHVKDLTDGRFCDVVIEAVGKQWPLDVAGEITRERGRLIIAGYHQDGARQVNMQLWNWRGLDVINAHEREPRICLEGIQAAVAMVACGELDPESLYTHRLPLDQLGEALVMTRDRPDEFMKALIIM